MYRRKSLTDYRRKSLTYRRTPLTIEENPLLQKEILTVEGNPLLQEYDLAICQSGRILSEKVVPRWSQMVNGGRLLRRWRGVFRRWKSFFDLPAPKKEEPLILSERRSQTRYCFFVRDRPGVNIIMIISSIMSVVIRIIIISNTYMNMCIYIYIYIYIYIVFLFEIETLEP